VSEPCRIDVRESALGRIFRALAESGCDPCWIAGGRAIVSDCPSCGERRGLLVEIRGDDEARA